jgi:Ser/Thr protein kinase RdoA (MazF antagonist)
VELSDAEGAIRAARAFHLPGPPHLFGPLAGGLIHRSWVIEAGGERFVLQRLNRSVFRDLDAVMSNIGIVTRHLALRFTESHGDDAIRRTLTLVAARDGRDWTEDDDGHAWRCTLYVEGSEARSEARTAEDAFQAGAAFGTFSRHLADLPTPLAVTIPGFHDTTSRLRALRSAVAADPVGRVARVQGELEAIREHEMLAHILPPLLASGVIPERTAHNDAKIANVLFDSGTGHALGVLDLDTVMPGTALHDVGDLIRSTVGSGAEDGGAGAPMRVRPELFAALAKGWLAGTEGAFTRAERDLFVTAGRIITYEQAVRFLADHIAGDVYYPTERPEHNLDRAQAQLSLFLDLTQRADELEEIVASN